MVRLIEQSIETESLRDLRDGLLPGQPGLLACANRRVDRNGWRARRVASRCRGKWLARGSRGRRGLLLRLPRGGHRECRPVQQGAARRCVDPSPQPRTARVVGLEPRTQHGPPRSCLKVSCSGRCGPWTVRRRRIAGPAGVLRRAPSGCPETDGPRTPSGIRGLAIPKRLAPRALAIACHVADAEVGAAGVVA